MAENNINPRTTVEVFVCYRQVDGKHFADQLYEMLDGLVTSDGTVINLYYDQRSAASGDWTRLHLPALQTANAFILLITPGIAAKTAGTDWVHMEIDWWLGNRNVAPIFVDVTGELQRWLPPHLVRRWPTPQFVKVEHDSSQSITNQDQVRGQIVEGLRTSRERNLYDELQKQKRIHHRLFMVSVISILAGLGSLLTLLLVGYNATRVSGQLTESALEAERALEAAMSGLDESVEKVRLTIPDVYITDEAAEGEPFGASYELPIPDSENIRIVDARFQARVTSDKPGKALFTISAKSIRSRSLTKTHPIFEEVEIASNGVNVQIEATFRLEPDQSSCAILIGRGVSSAFRSPECTIHHPSLSARVHHIVEGESN